MVTFAHFYLGLPTFIFDHGCFSSSEKMALVKKSGFWSLFAEQKWAEKMAKNGLKRPVLG
jgi:hypothetical protein